MSDIFDEIDAATQGNDTPPAPAPAPAPAPPPPAPGPHPKDIFDEIDARNATQPTPQQGMAAAAAASLGVAPDQAAKTATLASRLAVGQGAIQPVVKEAQETAVSAADRAHFDAIAERHPELAAWLSKPSYAAMARGDLANLRAISTAVQAINPTDDRPDLPLTAAFKVGVFKQVGFINKVALAGPSWLQQEARELFGIKSTPNPYTPLGMFYDAHDMATQIARQREDLFKPSVMRDLVSSTSGIIADPTTALLAPVAGANLMVKATRTLDVALQASAAIKGAALVQGLVAGGQTLVQKSEERQQRPGEASGALATTADVAVQGALAYFFGKLGQEIPIQRALGTSPFTAAPYRDLASDIARNAAVGGTQAVASGETESLLTGRGFDPHLAALYASGAIPGGLMAAGNVHEAAQAAHHWTAIKHAEGLTFANKLSDVVAAVKASTAAQHGPEHVGALIDSIVGAGKAPEHVYLQASEWQQHFLAKEMDPVAEAAKAGLQQEYVQARGLGGDMQIPLRQAIGMAAEAGDPAALVAQMRQHPLAPNAIEAATYFQTPSPDQVTAASSLAKEQVADHGEQAPSSVRTEREAQALAAGLPPEEAAVLGQLHQRFFDRLAEIHNTAREEAGGDSVTAEQLSQQFKLNIRRAIPEMLKAHLASGKMAEFLDNLRTTSPTTDDALMGRAALVKLGLDPQQHTNEQIVAALGRLHDQPAEGAKGEGIPYQQMPGRLRSKQRAAEQRFAQRLAEPQAAEDYAKIKGTEGGKVIDTDLVRELSPDYTASKDSRTHHTLSTHQPASAFARRLFDARMALPAHGPVVFIAGGGGSGKSHVRSIRPEMTASADTVVDGTLSNLGKAKEMIEQALVSGREVRIEYVYRDLIEAARAAADRTFENGRYVPAEPITMGHVGALESVLALAGHYATDPRVHIGVYENKKGSGIREITLDHLEKLRYDTRGEGVEATAKRLLPDVRKEMADVEAHVANTIERGEEGAAPGEVAPGTAEAAHTEPRGVQQDHGSPDQGVQQVDHVGREGGDALGSNELRQGAGPNGFYRPGTPEHLIALLESRDKSTAFHESAHYFLEVMSRLAAREGAPKELAEDLHAMLSWAGYGDLAGYQQAQEEMAAIQREIGTGTATDEQRARLKQLAQPHENFARGFEQYLMTGRAPAVGLRRGFARLKAMMFSVYKSVRNLLGEGGKPLDGEMARLFDRMLASEREIARAKGRVAEMPAFTDQASSGMGDRDWGRYLKAHADADRQEQEALEHEVLASERQARSEAFSSERTEVRGQKTEEVSRERVHDAIRQLQDGETWDGRTLAEPLKLARRDVDRLLTPEELKALPGPSRDRNRGRSITTPEDHGLAANDAALLLGYGTSGGLDMLREMMAAPDREAEIDRRTDAEMANRYPDPMDHQQVMEVAANKALHEPDARAVVHEMERAHLAKLVNADRARRADEAQGAILKGERADQAATLDKQAGGAANALGRDLLRQVSTRDERLAMRLAAEEALRGTKFQALDPDRYLAAERKAALAVAKALATKDYETALTQKRAQMMNAELARAAQGAHEETGKILSHLRKLGFDERLRTRIAKAGGLEWTATLPDGTSKVFGRPDAEGKTAQEQARSLAQEKGGTFDQTSSYLDQIDGLLERYELKPVSGKRLTQRQTMRDFLERVMAMQGPDGEPMPTGVYADIPAHLVDDARRVNLAELTVQDLRDLNAAASGIEALAKQTRDLMTTTRKERRDELAKSLGEQIRSTGKKKLPKVVRSVLGVLTSGGDGTTGGILTRTLRSIGNFSDELMQCPRLTYEMDGFKDAGTVARGLLFPFIDAANREQEMRAEVRKRTAEAVREWGKSSGYTREEIPGLGTNRQGEPWRLTLLDRIVALGHYGNPEGRQRLMDLNRWDDDRMHVLLDGLDAKDIAFANAMVDINSMHWPDVKAIEERYNGVAPPKVEAIPVELPNGTYKGGYQRIYYDGDSVTSLQHMAQEMATEGLTGGGYRRPTTARGATKERVEKVAGRVLSLDAMNWSRAHNEAIHDLTHRDAVHDQLSLLNHPDVRSAMQEGWGIGVWKQFVNQAVGVAQGNKPAVSQMERLAEHLRLCTNYSKRGFNPIYALVQYSGLPLARQRIGDRYLTSAMMQCFSGPLAIDHTSHWIDEQSATMRFRSRTRDLQIGDALSETSLSGGMRNFMDGAGMLMVLKAWQHMDNVTWKAAYDQHRDTGADHTDSVRVADQLVETLMGSNKQKDLPQVLRAGGPIIKMLTSNMSWSVANWNNIATEWNRSLGGLRRYGQGGWTQMAHGLGGLGTLLVAGPMFWDWWEEMLSGQDLSPWTDPSQLAHRAWTASAYAAFSGIPIVRDIEPQWVEGSRPRSSIGLDWMTAIQRAGQSLHTKKEYGYDTAKALVTGAATFLPIPSAAIFHAIDGFKQSQKHGDDFPGLVWKAAMGPTPKRP